MRGREPLPILTRVAKTLNATRPAKQVAASQRSLHNAPIFRLLLKVAVNGTHQCDFLNFCGYFGTQQEACVMMGMEMMELMVMVMMMKMIFGLSDRNFARHFVKHLFEILPCG